MEMMQMDALYGRIEMEIDHDKDMENKYRYTEAGRAQCGGYFVRTWLVSVEEVWPHERLWHRVSCEVS